MKREFKVGEIYEIPKWALCEEAGNIIKITEVDDTTVTYKTINGEKPDFECFDITSRMAYNLMRIEEAPKFKPGDKVILLDGSNVKDFIGGWCSEMKEYVGTLATIKEKAGGYGAYYVKENDWLWDMRAMKAAHNDCIIIMQDGRKITAYGTGKQGVARCNPEDQFNFLTGAKLALDRLYNNETPKKPKVYNGKIIFIKGDETFKTGHIYEIKNGRISIYGINNIPYDRPFRDVEDVKDYFTSEAKTRNGCGWGCETLEFIEVKDD